MKTIEDHIEFDKERIDDPTVSSAARRHYKEELHELQEYVGHHKKEIEKNPPSRSAKLRYVIRGKNNFFYPENFKSKFKKYLDLESLNDK